jgi:RNA polymerase sigma-70 factor (ECF subfamily)
MILSLLAVFTDSDRGAGIKRRDRAAWDELVNDQHARIFNLHLRLTGDRETAADLTQESFVAAYQSAHTYAGRARPETWLYGVALNCNRNWRRKSGWQEPPDQLSEELVDPQPSAEDLAQLREQSDLICGAVQRLPEVYRRVVALRYFAGVTAAEIAAGDGVDAGTVRWRLHRALQKLWVMLQPRLGKEAQDGSGTYGQLRITP